MNEERALALVIGILLIYLAINGRLIKLIDVILSPRGSNAPAGGGGSSGFG